MFGIFTGVLVNSVLIILGSMVGIIFKTEKLKRIGERVFQAFAFFVIMLGISGAMDLSHPIIMLISLVIGIAIGEFIDIDDKFNKLGLRLEKKFVKATGKAGTAGSQGANSTFAEGFVQSSLLFCIGSMAFLGAIQSGMQHQHSIYYTKGLLDCMSALTMATGNGIGVAFSSLSILVYQGVLTALASLIAPVMTEEIVALSSAIGSLFLIAIGTNMLGITKIKVANFLPAMFIPMLWQAGSLIFTGNGVAL